MNGNLTGMFHKLFGRTENVASRPMTDADSVKIITAYGKALLDRKSSYGDVSELPYAPCVEEH